MHQANGRLINDLYPKLGLPVARVHQTVEHYGTGAASVPVTLADAARRIDPGDHGRETVTPAEGCSRGRPASPSMPSPLRPWPSAPSLPALTAAAVLVGLVLS